MEVDDKIDTIYKFVAAYEVNKYSILRDGGMLPSVEEFMREYCERLGKDEDIKMETIYWSTEEPHADNNETMCDYLETINMLDITFVDGTYAEGVNAQGEKFAIHASGNGDCWNHKIEFERL